MREYKFKCKSCGATKYEKKGNNYICMYCGETVEVFSDFDEPNKKEENDEKTALEEKLKLTVKEKEEMKFTLMKLIFCVFLGVWGVHKFLEGKVFLGLVYIFTFGLFGIGIIIDLVRYGCDLLGYMRGGEKG